MKTFITSTVTTLVLGLTTQLAEASEPGPYMLPTTTNFAGSSFSSTRDRIVGTYNFATFYDVYASTHVINGSKDRHTDHPPNLIPQPGLPRERPPAVPVGPPYFSWRDINWLKKDISQMKSAGVDFAAFLWGRWLEIDDGKRGANRNGEGTINNINSALMALEAEGQPVPKVACFLGTLEIGIQKINLASVDGKHYLWWAVRDFYSRLHPRFWMRIDRKVPVVLWVEDGIGTSSPAGGLAQTFEYVKTNFKQRFGGVELMFIGSKDWRTKYRAPIDLTYGWGAARHQDGALIGSNDIAEIGPGFDYLGSERLKNPRREGATYRAGWAAAMNSGKRIVMIETWNEFYEATDIAESYEYGTKYVDITRQMTGTFHRLR